MPLQRRIPKRGFTPRKRTVYQIVNVGDLARVEGTTVNAEVLKEAGLIRSAEGLIKILAMGEVNQAYSVEAHKFSGGAVTKIEVAGGSATVLTRGGGNGAAEASEPATEEPIAEVAAETDGTPVAEVAMEADTEAAVEMDEAPAEEAAEQAEAPAAEDVEGAAETDG